MKKIMKIMVGVLLLGVIFYSGYLVFYFINRGVDGKTVPAEQKTTEQKVTVQRVFSSCASEDTRVEVFERMKYNKYVQTPCIVKVDHGEVTYKVSFGEDILERKLNLIHVTTTMSDLKAVNHICSAEVQVKDLQEGWVEKSEKSKFLAIITEWTYPISYSIRQDESNGKMFIKIIEELPLSKTTYFTKSFNFTKDEDGKWKDDSTGLSAVGPKFLE